MADGRQNNGARKGENRGQGRKPKADEQKVRHLAISAIIKIYGSEEKGFIALLESGEPTLRKLVYEYAYGKPTEKVQHSGDPELPVIFKLDGKFKDATGEDS
jgi:hypothetical protein